MTGQGTAARSAVAVRRTGHAVGALTGAALLVLIHVRPGWQVLPFLTPDTSRVLGIVDDWWSRGRVARPPRRRSTEA